MSKQGPPDELWLQWYCEEHDPDWGEPEAGNVTWCEDQQFSDDPRYVKADAVAAGPWSTDLEGAPDDTWVLIWAGRWPVIARRLHGAWWQQEFGYAQPAKVVAWKAWAPINPLEVDDE